MSESIVEISGLRKVYSGKNPVTAVDGIDLRVPAGEIYGLLGPNGAGKTTTISIATTRAMPTAGSVRIAGIDVVAHPALARRVIGVVPQYNTLDRACTVAENIHFHCLYFGMSRKRRRPHRPAARPVPPHRRAEPTRKPSAAASPSASRSPAPSPTGPRSCSSTSPPPASIRRAASPCGTPSGPARRRHHRRAHHPLHGRGRRALRPPRHHRPRQNPRRRHPRRPESPSAATRSSTSACPASATPATSKESSPLIDGVTGVEAIEGGLRVLASARRPPRRVVTAANASACATSPPPSPASKPSSSA